MSTDDEANLFDIFKERIDRLFSGGEFLEIVREANILLSLDPNGFNNRTFSAACFIDCAEVLNNLDLAERGIKLLESVLEETEVSQQTEISLKYNLSNGYTAKANILLGGASCKSEELQARRRSQTLLQELLIQKQLIGRNQLASILVNYANSLDHSNRSIEAIDYYYDALIIKPNHPNAMGNCGISIHRLLSVSNPHVLRNLSEALRLLNTTIANREELLKIAGPQALDAFLADLAKLDQEITKNFDAGYKLIQQSDRHRVEVHGQPEAPQWLERIRQDRLLLSLNLKPINSVYECKDDLYFQSISTRIEEGDERFNDLLHSFNTLKEDFVTARYLYYLSVQPDIATLSQYSALTEYGDALDYADYGLLSGLLKASFRVAADSLDKVALFINSYFGLGHEDAKVNFNNIWFDNLDTKKRTSNPVLEEAYQRNQFLSALRELHKEWYLQNSPTGPLRETRHAATHRTLVLYWMKPTAQEKTSFTWDSNSFREAVFFLLRMVKAAMIYLICMVTAEEQLKADNAGLTAPLEFRVGMGITDKIVQQSQKDEEVSNASSDSEDSNDNGKSTIQHLADCDTTKKNKRG